MRRATGLLVRAGLLATVFAGGLARAQEAPRDPGLAAGIRQVDEGDFEGAILTLTPVVKRLAPGGGHEASQACLYLGVAHLALDQRSAALDRFRQALDLEPDLRLSVDRFSPKVLGAMEEARRAREAEQEARDTAARPSSEPPRKGSHRTLLLVGAGLAAGTAVAVAAGGGSSSPPSPADLRFTSARFTTQAALCPDGSVAQPIPVGIDVDVTNQGQAAGTLSTVTSVLIIVSSPAVPSEVGFASSMATTADPTTFPAGATTLHVRTTLSCGNGVGDPSRFNEWTGRVTLVTASGAFTVETADRLRVNIP